MSSQPQLKVVGPEPIDAYRESIAALAVAPLWDVLKGLVPPEPRPSAKPHKWQWSILRERLLEAGQLISAEEAERRVLMLKNPGMQGAPNVTDTLYAGLQLILPGEIARAHRHSQSALRFVLEGTGGYTSVDGYRTDMARGDFILTPPWVWHDHGNDGDGPVMWLDGLDVPLVSFLKAGFREEYEDMVFPKHGLSSEVTDRYMNALLPLVEKSSSLSSPIFNYPYDRTRETLARLAAHGEVDACHGVAVRYAHPLNGGSPMPTISASMRLIPSGMTTDWFQSVDGTIVVGMEGGIRLDIDGGESTVLDANDVFAVPGWTRWRTSNTGAGDAVLFAYSDRPVYDKLGLYREKRG